VRDQKRTITFGQIVPNFVSMSSKSMCHLTANASHSQKHLCRVREQPSISRAKIFFEAHATWTPSTVRYLERFRLLGFRAPAIRTLCGAKSAVWHIKWRGARGWTGSTASPPSRSSLQRPWSRSCASRRPPLGSLFNFLRILTSECWQQGWRSSFCTCVSG